MAPFPQDFDDATLAAFIAGTLPADRREAVVARLAQDEHLREVLRMACELLETSHPDSSTDTAGEGQPPPKAPVGSGRGWGLAGFVAVFVLGLGVRLGLGSPWPEAGRIHVEVTTRPPVVHWQAIPQAERYCVTIWRPETAQQVIRFETTTPHVDATHPFWDDLRARSRGSWLLRVEALGPRNRVVDQSPFIDLPRLQ